MGPFCGHLSLVLGRKKDCDVILNYTKMVSVVPFYIPLFFFAM